MELKKVLRPIARAAIGFGNVKNYLSRPDGIKKHLFAFGEEYRMDPQWFQKGAGPPKGSEPLEVSTVYACIKIISEEMARLKLTHGKLTEGKGIELMPGSAVSRVLRKPNSYQTRSDFILNMMLNLLLSGNGCAIATRNKNGSVSELHPAPRNGCTPHVVPDTGDIWYGFSGYDLTYSEFEGMFMVPQRDVLHVRLFTPTHPLIGQTPLVAAGMSMSTHQAINGQSCAFFNNMSRPDGILTTPKPLNTPAATRLKTAWESRAAGKTPVLDNDIKYMPLTMTAVDSEIIKQFDLSARQIANVFRVPLDFLGMLEKATYGNVEQMQRRFILSTLGFYLEHLECAFDAFFGLPSTEEIRFDLESGMMRPDLESRMTAYSKGVQGAVMTPNEARERENLASKPGGDDLYMQKQNWPIDMLGMDAAPPDAPGDVEPDPDPESDDDDDDDDDSMSDDEIKAYLGSMAA